MGDQRSDAPADNAYRSAGSGMTAVSYLLAGIGLYGALGWLADRLLHATVFLPVGLVVGAAAAVYLIIKRFGGDE